MIKDRQQDQQHMRALDLEKKRVARDRIEYGARRTVSRKAPGKQAKPSQRTSKTARR
jgi:hypothetical protein